MSFSDCIDRSVNAGEISAGEGARLKADFDAFRRRRAPDAPGTADAAAREALAQLLAAETAHRRRQAALSVQALRRLGADLDGFRNQRGQSDVGLAALYTLENNGEAPFSSVAGRAKEIIGLAHARMEDVLHHFRRSAVAGDLGRHNRADLGDVVREAFGEATGNARAAELARAWGETADWLRQRFNAAGGAIGRLENWGLPQRHDARALRARGREQWKADIAPMLDTTRMRHPLSGEPVGRAELDSILDDIWSSIATDGWDTREPSRQALGRGALANQHAEHRFLVFRDADAWLAYQRDYGGATDPFAAMMGHINMMARDTAAMEILGPNPTAMVGWLKQAVQKAGAEAAAGQGRRMPGRDPLDRARRINHRIEALWGSIRGELNQPGGGRFVADTMAAVRNVITANVLGSAVISTLSDVGTQMVVRRFAGLSNATMFRDMVSAMTPAGRREAVQAGLILDGANHVFHTNARYVGTLNGPFWSQYLADRVLTFSGLTPWTQASRHAFGMGFLHEVAGQAGRSWADLHPVLRETFEAHGLGRGDWELLRTTPVHTTDRGLTLLRPTDAAAVDQRVAERYLGMVQGLTELAVPNGNHRARTILLDQNQRGTLPGEILRSFAQFKSFGAVMGVLHGARIHKMLTGNRPASGAAYAGALLISTTLLGALALQLKQVAAGRDPRDMDTGAFWLAAMLQGGGLGIYGDFLFADTSRTGGGLATTIGGPVAQRLGDFSSLTIGNLVRLGQGQRVNMGRDLTNFLRGNTPGGTIWYARLAYERLLLDQLQWLADPEAAASFRSRQQFWRREFGQEFWWAPGTPAPQRAPAPIGG